MRVSGMWARPESWVLKWFGWGTEFPSGGGMQILEPELGWRSGLWQRRDWCFLIPTPLQMDVVQRRGCLFPHHPPFGDITARQPMAKAPPFLPLPIPFPFQPKAGADQSDQELCRCLEAQR